MKCILVCIVLLMLMLYVCDVLCVGYLVDDDVYDYIYICSIFGVVYGMGWIFFVKFKFW